MPKDLTLVAVLPWLGESYLRLQPDDVLSLVVIFGAGEDEKWAPVSRVPVGAASVCYRDQAAFFAVTGGDVDGATLERAIDGAPLLPGGMRALRVRCVLELGPSAGRDEGQRRVDAVGEGFAGEGLTVADVVGVYDIGRALEQQARRL